MTPSDGFGYPKTRNLGEKPNFFGMYPTRTRELIPDINPTFKTRKPERFKMYIILEKANDLKGRTFEINIQKYILNE